MAQLNHIPVRPARPGHPETVFATQWQALMDSPPEQVLDTDYPTRLAQILHPMPGPVTQRRATVAASLVCWIGTNCGMALIERGRHEFPGLSRREAFRAAWALTNARVGCRNGGVRTLEAMLAPEDHFGRDPFDSALGIRLLRLPDISADDYEVAEHIVVWLASDEGAAFIACCEAEIAARRDAAAA